jgi:TolB-like protein
LDKACDELVKYIPANSKVAVLAVTSTDVGLSASIIDEINRNLTNSGRFRVLDEAATGKFRGETGLRLNGEVPGDVLFLVEPMLEAGIVITGSVRGSGSNQILSFSVIEADTFRVLLRSMWDFK